MSNKITDWIENTFSLAGAKQDYSQLQWQIAARSILSPVEGGREENQDNYLLINEQGHAESLTQEKAFYQQLTGWEKGHRRLAILDGMGGHRDGREVTESIVKGLKEIPAGLAAEKLCEQLEKLHSTIQSQFGGGHHAPGAALTLLEYQPSELPFLFHTGDTRLYEITDESVNCLTVDHVPSTYHAMLGLIEKDEWIRRVHKESQPRISQAFALGNSLSGKRLENDELIPTLYELTSQRLPGFLNKLADRRRINLKQNKLYLLASDGLWDFSEPELFVQQWPSLWCNSEHNIDDFLDKVLLKQKQYATEEEATRMDNTTVIAICLKPISNEAI